MEPPFLSEADFLILVSEYGLWSEQVAKAVEQAKRSHGAQTRDNGRPYLTEHIFPVAEEVICSYGIMYGAVEAPECSVIAALLHDAVEDDPSFSVEDCVREFGAEVADLVAVLTKLPEENVPFLDQAERMRLNSVYLERVKGGPEVARVIKLADRLNNLASVESIRLVMPDKYKRYIVETRVLFLPLALVTSEYFYSRLLRLLNALEGDSRYVRDGYVD